MCVHEECSHCTVFFCLFRCTVDLDLDLMKQVPNTYIQRVRYYTALYYVRYPLHRNIIKQILSVLKYFYFYHAFFHAIEMLFMKCLNLDFNVYIK
jgi:hypothetical protein